MLEILEKYRFYLTLPSGEVRVYPDNAELLWIHERNEDYGFWRRLLDTELVFTNNAHDTFEQLRNLEASPTICYKVLLRVERWNGAVWVTCWNGYLPFRKGNWSDSRQTVFIKPRVQDVYNCVINEEETEVNLLNIVERLTIQTIEGSISELNWRVVASDLLQTNDGKNLTTELALEMGNQYAQNNLGPNYQVCEFEYFVQRDINGQYYWELLIKYCREESNVLPSDPNQWVLDGSTYTRTLPLQENFDVFGSIGGGAESYSIIGKREAIDFTADNAILFSDALDYLLEQICGVEIVSNFFNVNATGDDPDNEEYIEAAKDFNKIALFQASDLIYAGKGEPATILNASFKMLVGSLFQKFPLVFFYDDTISKFRLEHITYIARANMLDMTHRAEDIETLKGNKEYEYKTSDFPLIETWEDKYSSGDDFTDATIEYDRSCASDLRSEQKEDYKAEDIIFDIQSIYKNEELIEDKDIRTSIVMVALNTDNSIKVGTGVISGQPNILNHVFASGNIIEKYYMIDRPLLTAQMNGKPVIFKSTKPVRVQNELSTTLTDEDYWEVFDPLDRVRTQYGWGELREDVEYEEPIRQLKFVPQFRIK